ncbi:MAG: SH3 domain-containing protein, partial [Thermomicrobiales bacterium]
MQDGVYETPEVRLDRRVVLKAAAAFGAMSLVGATHPEPASAQASDTLADTFVEANTVRAASVNEPYTFEASFPFYAVGGHWDGGVNFPVLLELSFSTDGVTYTDPVLVGAAEEDAGRPNRGGRHFSDLAFTDGARFIRYRTLDGDGNPAQLTGFQLTYIDASAGPTGPSLFASSLEPSVAKPPVISRSAWGANESYRYGPRGEIWPPEYAPVEHVIIHHTETSNFQDPLIAIRSIYYYHAVTRGWGDIGYNYLVDYTGNVYEGRVGGENVIGGHAYQYAEGSSGIGTIGNFSFQDATAEAQTGIVWITSYVARDLNPLAVKDFNQVPNLPTICGHRDVNLSSCPGEYLYADLPTIRQYAAEVINGRASPSPDDGALGPGSVVQTVVNEANMRSRPGLQASVVARLPLGTSLTITDGPTSVDGYSWYAVTTSRYGAGWVASIVFGPTTTPQQPPATGAFQIGDTVTVNTDRLNLRSTPSLSGSVVAIMPSGTPGTVIGGPRADDGYTWYQLRTAAGTGWAAGSFLQRSGSTAPPPATGTFSAGSTVVVDTDVRNMRSAPGTRQPVVATLPTNATLTVTAGPTAANGYQWYAVTSMRYGDGWVAGQFLRLAAGSSPQPQPEPEPSPQPPPSGTYPVGTRLIVATDGLNMRSGPSLSRSVIATLPQGTRVEVTDQARSAEGFVWYGVYAGTYGGGWCVARYLQPAEGSAPAPTRPPTSGLLTGDLVRVVRGRLNVRSGPSLN